MPAVRLLLALVIVALASPAFAATRIRVIHGERNKLSADARREAVLADLTTMLQGPAGPTNVATRPYVSSRNGLCRRDIVSLAYAPVKEGGYAVKPVGIQSVFTQYHFLGYENEGTRDGWQKACEQLTGKDVYWAASRDDYSAAFALATLNRVLVDVRNRQRVTIDCSPPDGESAPADPVDCRSLFLRVASRTTMANPCPSEDDSFKPCYAFRMDDYDVKVVTTFGKNVKDPYSTAIRMTLDDSIIIT